MANFLIAHQIPSVVKEVSRLRPPSLSRMDALLAEARAKYQSIPARVWVGWDAGRSKKSDQHLAYVMLSMKYWTQTSRKRNIESLPAWVVRYEAKTAPARV